LEDLKQKLSLLPYTPGVYQFINAEGNIIYVGKAKSLRNRVSSYFNRQDNGKTRILVSKICDIKIIEVETETDALLLENSLIKKYRPRYNILLKDDKTYPWIVIKNEPFPRIFSTRLIIKDGSEYFGPYASVKQMYAILELIKESYPFRSCQLRLYEQAIAAGKFSDCLEYQIGNCGAPCTGKQNAGSYAEGVNYARKLLKGQFSDLLKDLKTEMQSAASDLKFERALLLKLKLEILQSFQAKSTVVHPDIHDVDVFSMASDDETAIVNFMKVNNGIIVQSHNLELRKKINEPDDDILTYAILHIREKFNSTSQQVFLPQTLEFKIPDIELVVPKRGDKRKLVELSLRNATRTLLETRKQEELKNPSHRADRIMETAQRELHLQQLPRHIECFDNSNIQGAFPVSACVVFRNTKPSKKEYRIFHPRSVEGPDDFQTMREGVLRRYRRMIKENESLPDLIIIDGGIGQLNAALESLEELGLRGKIAIIGIAKKLEEIYFPDDDTPIHLDKRSETLRLIQQLRDEAHDYGLGKHRDRRSKAQTTSLLEQIPGVGKQTTRKLLTAFAGLDAIRNASIEDLERAVSTATARNIIRFFQETHY
jgi:excinuclease ABC subunit C